LVGARQDIIHPSGGAANTGPHIMDGFTRATVREGAVIHQPITVAVKLDEDKILGATAERTIIYPKKIITRGTRQLY
jgi:hypothetical protein